MSQVANLGSGAFAHVEWAVLRQANGEDMNVAVKRLREDLISSDQDLSDFVREGALLKRLNHPCAPRSLLPAASKPLRPGLSDPADESTALKAIQPSAFAPCICPAAAALLLTAYKGWLYKICRVC